MQPTLDSIESTIRLHTSDPSAPTTLIAAGDFNRHHPAWSDSPVYARVMVHAAELINFIHAHALQWCLGKGNPTYWAYNRPGQNSTIDLTLTNEQWRLVKCGLYHDNYGSDHRAILSEWCMHLEQRPRAQPRKAYERADWSKIGKEIQMKLGDIGEIVSQQCLDETVDELITVVEGEVNKHVPETRPSPYAKRWFNPDLKIQQSEVNKLRRKWQECCASSGRDDPRAMRLFTEMHSKRRAWTRAIERAKSSHWKEFLDQASSQTVWKISRIP